ncbi:MAG TPA: DUF4173 domain-containing protein [Amycolatopsis sp.]|nr:DUF4173 domain-containing protein [Amycolatopsis sp.]
MAETVEERKITEGVLTRTLPPPKSAVVPMPPSVLPAAALAGIAGAVLVPLDRPGIGWVLAGIATVVAVFVADRMARGDNPKHFTVASAGWASLALALLAMGAVRASEWLFTLCVLAAVVTGSLAVAGKRTVNSLLYDVLAVPIEALRSIPWVARGLGRLTARRGGMAQRVLLATLATIVLLAVFIPLLNSSDEAFAQVMAALMPDLAADKIVRWVVVFAVVALAVAGACYLLAAPPLPALDDRPPRTGRALEWTVPLTALVLLFALFVGVRLAVLFGGTGYVLRTDGLTSAQYARGGFWQLCACTVLTLALIAAALRWAPDATRADRIRQRGLLGVLSVLSLVIVGSALSRMWTYQEAYGFTVLRLLVEVCELWLGCVFLLVLASLMKLRSSWLPRAAIGTAAAALLALAVLDPERVIADANIDRFALGKTLDVEYLGRFSADVVETAAERLPEPERTCVLRTVLARLGDDGWTGWNLARAGAQDYRNVLASVGKPVNPARGCAV